ncbi:MAG: YidC/Oxa1 family membrane protein insertase [Chloroflexi bacterium]|nr:YidC/Oxa1 family membrane protein insertase [Chloroflexota bacterium]
MQPHEAIWSRSTRNRVAPPSSTNAGEADDGPEDGGATMTDTWQLLLETPLVNFMVLLSFIAFGSYGAAILVFTVLTRVVTFPLTMRTLRATRGLQELQPEMQAIQKRHSDPKRRSEEQMKLYRRKTLACEDAGVASALLAPVPVECDWKGQHTDRGELFEMYVTHLDRVHGVRIADASGRQLKQARKAIAGGINPIGCLGPQLVQLPIFFALFSVIRLTLSQAPEDTLELSDRLYDFGPVQNAIPLDTSFLGMNLAANGNIVLVVVIFCSMWLTQRISSSRAAAQPGTSQAQTQQMMQWMLPLMFGWFALFVPAGLGLYWAASTLIGLVLQWVFVGPGDFTWGSLIPVFVRTRIGMSAEIETRSERERRLEREQRRAASDEETDGNEPPAEDGAGDDGAGGSNERRRGKRQDGRRRRRTGSRQARGGSRSRRRRGNPRG